MWNQNDTIAAIATPLGVGGVGVVRVSGKGVSEIAKQLLGGKPLQPNRAYHAWLPRKIDESVITYFKAPNSYTGEDVLELSCHGSPVVVRQVLALVLGLGARQAERGEFTQRAFLNGKIDLLQAESVLALISAQTSALAETAALQLKGELSKKIESIKEKCLAIITEIQGSIDFPDDVPEAKELGVRVGQILTEICEILSTAEYGKLLRNGVTVTIAGKPNVGKSSLLNALLRVERAIVDATPGTTRDAIIESINLNGILVKLIDTAGVREAKEGAEKQGVARAKSHLASSDLALLVYDGSQPLDGQDKAVAAAAGDRPKVVVLNKCDLGVKANVPGIKVSALTGEGIKGLEAEIYRAIAGEGAPKADCVITSERQTACLSRAKKTLQAAQETVRIGKPVDLVSLDVQAAVEALGEMLGTQVSDEVVSKIFTEFCVGK